MTIRPSRAPSWDSRPAASFTSTRSPSEGRAHGRWLWRSLALLALAGCQPAPAKQPEAIVPSPLDRFHGDILQPNGARTAYSVILVPDPRDTRVTLGIIDIPSQALAGATHGTVRFARGQRIEFELEASGRPHWRGVVDSSGTIRCTYSQSGLELPCTMQALPAYVPAAARP